MSARRVFFVLFDGCEVMDLAGPAQAFFEASSLGRRYDCTYCGVSPEADLAQGLRLTNLARLPDVGAHDWVFVPGYLLAGHEPSTELLDWLASVPGLVCSVCTGAFALGAAGLLDGRRCTTHWRRIPELRERFPTARVLEDRLWVEDGRVVTSAGIAAGIDMALGLIARDAGERVASAVAREMVLYLRRSPGSPQRSVYLDHQNHLHPGVHRVQQHLIDHPGSAETLDELAGIGLMSKRNLTRTFRQATGLSVGEFRTRVRLEHATQLLRQTDDSVESVAAACGLADARHLHRLCVERLGVPPSGLRDRSAREQ